jgi:hypothetical protein
LCLVPLLLQKRYSTNETANNGWRLGLTAGWIVTALLFGATIITAICRLGGLAHTVNAVMSGFVLSAATTLIPLLVFWSAYSYITRDKDIENDNAAHEIDDTTSSLMFQSSLI